MFSSPQINPLSFMGSAALSWHRERQPQCRPAGGGCRGHVSRAKIYSFSLTGPGSFTISVCPGIVKPLSTLQNVSAMVISLPQGYNKVKSWPLSQWLSTASMRLQGRVHGWFISLSQGCPCCGTKQHYSQGLVSLSLNMCLPLSNCFLQFLHVSQEGWVTAE